MSNGFAHKFDPRLASIVNACLEYKDVVDNYTAYADFASDAMLAPDPAFTESRLARFACDADKAKRRIDALIAEYTAGREVAA